MKRLKRRDGETAGKRGDQKFRRAESERIKGTMRRKRGIARSGAISEKNRYCADNCLVWALKRVYIENLKGNKNGFRSDT